MIPLPIEIVFGLFALALFVPVGGLMLRLSEAMAASRRKLVSHSRYLIAGGGYYFAAMGSLGAVVLAFVLVVALLNGLQQGALIFWMISE